MHAKRELDEFDRLLLRRLQDDALLTADALARDVALSPSAITRRVRRLRETGIITGDAAIVDDRIGPFLQAWVDVQLDRHARADIDALLGRLAASPNVQVVMEVTGQSDLLVLIAISDMDAFNVFVDTMLASDTVVRRYETRFVKRRRKFTSALPI